MLRVPVSIWLSFVSEPHEEHHDSQSSKEGPLASITKLRQISNAAEGLITFDELRAKLGALEEARQTARKGLAALEARIERLQSLERDRDALLEMHSRKLRQPLDLHILSSLANLGGTDESRPRCEEMK